MLLNTSVVLPVGECWIVLFRAAPQDSFLPGLSIFKNFPEYCTLELLWNIENSWCLNSITAHSEASSWHVFLGIELFLWSLVFVASLVILMYKPR